MFDLSWIFIPQVFLSFLTILMMGWWTFMALMIAILNNPVQQHPIHLGFFITLTIITCEFYSFFMQEITANYLIAGGLALISIWFSIYKLRQQARTPVPTQGFPVTVHLVWYLLALCQVGITYILYVGWVDRFFR